MTAVLLSVCVDVAHGAAVWSSIMTILGSSRAVSLLSQSTAREGFGMRTWRVVRRVFRMCGGVGVGVAECSVRGADCSGAVSLA